MTEVKKIRRLSKVAREFNVGISTIIEFLDKKGIELQSNPNTKINEEVYDILMEEYLPDIKLKRKSERIQLTLQEKKETISVEKKKEEIPEEEIFQPVIKKPKILGKIELDKPKKKDVDKPEKEPKPKKKITESISNIDKAELKDELKVVGKIDLSAINQKTRPKKKTKAEKKIEREAKEKTKKAQKDKTVKEKTREKELKTEVEKPSKPSVFGKPGQEKKQEVATPSTKKKRRRIKKSKINISAEQQGQKGTSKPGSKRKRKKVKKEEIREEDVQKQIKETLSRLTKKKSKAAKYRKEKRDAASQKMQEIEEELEKEKSILKLTEFVTVNELAQMMEISVNEVIATCMNLGLFVSINQRLDAETIALVAGEFNFDAEFISADILDDIEDVTEESEEELEPRSPVVTVMGHVDHGKTSLLDYIRKTNVIAGESGGITQHIGAYHVKLEDSREITFLDTPGHEAFTAMRARGAQATDIAIIIIAADDNVMPQTVEAINHASAAGVPIVFAINKIDRPGADPEKIKSELANMNYMVEEWGGKFQSQEISAKKGTNIEELLEKVLLEAEMLELKSNPNKKASGTVLESSLDKGRGYVATVLVQSGTLKIGDILLAGSYTGTVKAMFNERDQKIKLAGPAMPAVILGLNGAPQAGDNFNAMESEKEARSIANKREQLQREQGLRTQKHITLSEIGRRIAIGNFQELNIIVKGDVDGSIEALSDSLINLSTEEIQVNVIHKGVGQISENDIVLATASNAIIIGFQVRPSISARRLAEKEGIDIRLYSVIYDAINEVKQAMEGMLSPDMKEKILGSAEILEIFKITKVGTVAGCIVREGKITRNAKVRVIREGIVSYTGNLGSLKRFKEDVKEVAKGFECGLNIENFNDIKVGDNIEAFEEIEVKKTL